MSWRERLSGIWLISMTLLALCAYTVFFVAQMWLNLLHALFLGLVILQVIALIMYLWGTEKLKRPWQKIVYRVLYLSSFAVIPAFLFIFMGLISQYHAPIPESIDAKEMAAAEILPGEKTTIYNTGTVYVFFPEFDDVDLVCETRPSRGDESITWCSGAAFQHDVTLRFSQDDIEGDHAVNGTLYESPYNKDSYAAFVCTDGKFAFEFDNPREAVRKAAESGGSGFMQFGLIRDGETVMTINRPRARCYRSLAELNGHLCVIDSVNMLPFDDFMAELHRLGVTHALYMDMGAGWNYSWYRDVQERVVTLFQLPVPWSHNWVVFRKS